MKKKPFWKMFLEQAESQFFMVMAGHEGVKFSGYELLVIRAATMYAHDRTPHRDSELRAALYWGTRNLEDGVCLFSRGFSTMIAAHSLFWKGEDRSCANIKQEKKEIFTEGYKLPDAYFIRPQADKSIEVGIVEVEDTSPMSPEKVIAYSILKDTVSTMGMNITIRGVSRLGCVDGEDLDTHLYEDISMVIESIREVL